MHSNTSWGSSCVQAHVDSDFISSQKAQLFYSREVCWIKYNGQTPCFCVAILMWKCYYGSQILFSTQTRCESNSYDHQLARPANLMLVTMLSQSAPSINGCSMAGTEALLAFVNCSWEENGGMTVRKTCPAIFVQLRSPSKCIQNLSFITVGYLIEFFTK